MLREFYMCGKKSQSSLIILVGIVSVVMIVWAITAFSQVSFSEKSLKELKITKLSGYLDYFKGYIRNALIFSTHANTQLVANYGGAMAGDGRPRSWICTSPKPPAVDEIRYYLSEETIKTLNTFAARMNETKKDEIVDFFVGKFNCVDYDVNENNVMSGSNDEKFNVGGYGSYLTLIQEGDIINSSNNIYEEIPKVRFWYLYRNFREWAEENSLSAYMCDCMWEICKCDNSGSCSEQCQPFYECYKNAVNNALQDLQNKFDNYVSCTASYGCCYQEKQSCGEIKGCVPWKDPPKCNRCRIGNPKELCSEQELTFAPQIETPSNTQLNYYQISASTKKYYYNVRLATTDDECSQHKAEMWNTVKGAVETEFSCTDRKYTLSTENDKYLTFSVETNIALKARRCYDDSPCECVWICPVPGYTINNCPEELVCDRCQPVEIIDPANPNLHWCIPCPAP